MPKVLVGVTNRCHNKLRGKLARTFLDIPQLLGIGMNIAGNHENLTPILNEVLSGTTQHKGSIKQS